ncbi:ATP-grasp fold amidoligase family protein [Cupriavidus oxalaticus]|uniref:ATP-grasp fold amidoligase family protein n=1 Tax=Cupriavidus oxalaticus TaxID=96344 RepID=UPI003177C229
MKWTERQKLRIGGEEKDVPWWVNDKLKLANFCKENDLPTPNIDVVWEHPDQIDLSSFGENFVLKPSVLHSARGVMVLKRLPDGKFYDGLTQRELTQETIIKEQTKHFEDCKYKSNYRIFIEEKVAGDDEVGGAVPLDYKIYCFYGVPRMVFQFNRNHKPKRAAWFDGQFRPIRMRENIRSDWKFIHHGVHILPREWEKMLEIASRASKLVKTPFISVDMFSSKRGPLIGELTPAPGGPFYGDMYKFSEEFDTDLGREWAAALERMKGDVK